jgi:two-component system sensor histidine kinase QseC
VRSIRRALLASILGGLAVVLALAGAAVHVVARHGFRAQLDDALAARAQTFAALVIEDEMGIEFDYQGSLREDDLGVLVRVRSSDGTILAQSPGWPELRDLAPVLDGPALLADAEIEGHGGRAAAVARRAIHDPDDAAAEPDAPEEPDEVATGAIPGGFVVVEVIGRTSAVRRAESALAAALMAGGAFAAVGTAAAVALGVRRGLAPLRRLSAELERIDAAAAPARPPGAYPVEIRPLVAALARMLDRVRAAIERERRFTDAAAHELRTPIAELRTVTDVAERWPEPARLQSAVAEARAIANEMESLLESLLAAVRGGLDETRPAELVPLLGLARGIAEGRREQLVRRQVSCAIEGDEAAGWTGPRGAIVAIVRNLIDNAAEYTPDGGTVRVSAALDGAGARLEVENGPVALDPGEVDRLFEPFWRADRSRTDRRHRGLGLAIVAARGDALGLRRAVVITPERRLRISLSES